ncbi:MAG: DUF2232 domain-containing protein [Veillonella sp.]|nr:DUF2232 domain-containing protein [Veillonella sp.]
MKQTNTRAMVETGFVSAIGVILSAISVYLPAFAFLSFFVTPAAIGIIGTKWGRKYSISAAVVTTFLAVVLFGPWNGIPVGLFAAVGVGVGEGNRLSLGTIKRLLLPSIAMFVAVLVTLMAQVYVSGITLSMIDTQMTEQARMIADQALQTNPNITQEQVDLFVKNVDKLATGLKDAFFVAVAIAAVSYSYITIQISIWLGLYALGIIGIYGTPHINMDSSWVIAISTNVLLLGSSMCSIHGFAALADLMSSYRMSNKLKWILLGVYAFFFGQALAIFGVIDMFLDLRTRYKARQ